MIATGLLVRMQAFAGDFCADNRQSRRHYRPGVRRHLRRHRPIFGIGFHIAVGTSGALLGRGLVAVLYPQAARVADEVIVSHHNRKIPIDQWRS